MANVTKHKVRKNIAKAVVHIKASFNNTLITVTDVEGGAICTSSAGCVGFKGARVRVRPLRRSRRRSVLPARLCATASVRSR